MPRVHTSQSLIWAVAGSVAIHALAVTGLAWAVITIDAEPPLALTHHPFAGDRVAISLQVARPEITVPPLPDAPSADSPVLITPEEAHVATHVYVEKSPSEVEALIASRSAPLARIAEETAPPLPVAERDVGALKITKPLRTPPATTSVAKAMRDVQPSTATVAVPPRSLGSSRAVRFSHTPPPRYPDLAKRQRWQGNVLLKLSIDVEGRVVRVQVVESSGHALLDAEAAAAARIWRGSPALRGGRPEPTEVYQPFHFRL
jgi:protein TonB